MTKPVDPRSFRQWVEKCRYEGLGRVTLALETAEALADMIDAPIPAPRVEVTDPARLAAATRIAQAELDVARHWANGNGGDPRVASDKARLLTRALEAEAAYWGGL